MTPAAPLQLLPPPLPPLPLLPPPLFESAAALLLFVGAQSPPSAAYLTGALFAVTAVSVRLAS